MGFNSNAPVDAAWISGTATVIAVVVAALLAVWRFHTVRAYDRRVKNLETLQDRSAELARATRAYGTTVQARTRANEAAAPIASDTDNLIEAQLSPRVKTDYRDAADLVVVAATRVEEQTIVRLNEHWRSMSWRHSVDPKDVTAIEEQTARDWFDRACAQALTSRNARLTSTQRDGWQTELGSVVDDSNDTDPER